MKVYADRPLRRAAQFTADLLALLSLVSGIRLAMAAHEQISRLDAPGHGLIDAGGGLRDTFASAADNADDVPIVGDALAGALNTGSGAGTKLADAGQWQVAAVADLAWWIALLLVAGPVLVLLVTWLPLRWRFARRATAGARLRALGVDGHDVLALRALTGRTAPQRAGELAAGWRARDPEALAELADWELRRLGLSA